MVPHQKFHTVSLWHLLEQISVEAILYKFLNENASSYQLMQMTKRERYSNRSYILKTAELPLIKVITADENWSRNSK